MLLHLIFTLFLFVPRYGTSVASPYYIFLRSDCQLLITKENERRNVKFDITPPDHARCQEAEILEYTISGSHYLVIASYASETTLNMNIVPLDLTSTDSPTTIETESANFSHVLTEDCKFNHRTFAMGLYGRLLYFVASCESGKSFALARGVIGLDGQWYIPHGPLIHFVGNEKGVDGVFFWVDKITSGIREYIKPKICLYKLEYAQPHKFNFFDVRDLHSLNTTKLSDPMMAFIQVDKFRSTSAPHMNFLSWSTLEVNGCFSHFKYGEDSFEFPYMAETFQWPCFFYTAQQVDVANTAQLPDRLEFKFVDVNKKNASYECDMFAKTLADEADIKCTDKKGNLYTIILSCIIGAESLALIIIGGITLTMFLIQKRAAKKKGAKIEDKKKVSKGSETTPKTDQKVETDKKPKETPKQK